MGCVDPEPQILLVAVPPPTTSWESMTKFISFSEIKLCLQPRLFINKKKREKKKARFIDIY